MNSVYADERWAKIQEPREGGVLTEYKFENKEGTLIYRFIKKYAGTMGSVGYYDIASYRGAGGPIIERVEEGCEDHFVKAFIRDFDYYCNENNIIAEFAKIDPWNEYHTLIEQNYGAAYYGNFYCCDLTGDFYKQFNRNARRAVKKAENGGVEFHVDRTGETIGDFVRLYENTEAKYHTGNYYNFSEEDVRQYFRIFEENVFLSNAVYKEEVITSVLVVCGEDIVHYFLLGNDPEHLDLQCNSLLTYQTALYGQKLGKKLFDMGGGKPGGNIELFKKNFCGDAGIYPYYAVKKIRNQKVYDYFVTERGEIKNDHFFPLYRG